MPLRRPPKGQVGLSLFRPFDPILSIKLPYTVFGLLLRAPPTLLLPKYSSAEMDNGVVLGALRALELLALSDYRFWTLADAFGKL